MSKGRLVSNTVSNIRTDAPPPPIHLTNFPGTRFYGHIPPSSAVRFAAGKLRLATHRARTVGMVETLERCSYAPSRRGQVVPAMGVLWCASDNLLQPARFIGSAKVLAEKGQTPADIWVRLMAAKLPQGLVIGTHRLAAYAGRELEFVPTRKLDFGTLGMRIVQMALYLIDSDTELNDGNTIGPESLHVARGEHAYFDPDPDYTLRIA